MKVNLTYLRVFTVSLILMGVILKILKNDYAQFVLLTGALLGIYLGTKKR